MEENSSKNRIEANKLIRILQIQPANNFDWTLKEELNIQSFSSNFKTFSFNEVKEKYGISLEVKSSQKILVVENIEVWEEVHLERTTYPLLIINSKFAELTLGGSVQFQKKIKNPIYFTFTTISKLTIENCFIDNLVIDNNTQIESFYIIDNSNIKSLDINNTTIDVFIFKKAKIGKICKFFNCRTKEIRFEGGEINDLTLKDSFIQGNLLITDSKVNQLLVDNTKIKGLWQNKSTKVTTLSLSNKSELNAVEISDNCYFYEFILNHARVYKLEIKQNCILDELKVKNETFLESFICSDANKILKLLVVSAFLKEAEIASTEIGEFNFEEAYTGHITIKLANIEDLIVDKGSKTGDIDFNRCHIDYLKLDEHFGSLTFAGSKIKLGKIDRSNIHRFDISMGSEFEIYLKNCQVNWLSFTQTTLSKNSLLSISEGSVYCAQMEEFTVQGALHFRKIINQQNCFDWWWESSEKVKNKLPKGFLAVIKKLRYEYEKEVRKLKGTFYEPTIRVSHSTLGKTEFTNCPLDNFRFEFNNSKVTDCFISGGTVPSEKIIIIDDKGSELETGKSEIHRQKASIYNQFKKVFEAQGDAYRAAQFQAKWAEHQNNHLKLEYASQKKKFGFLNKSWARIKLICSELSQDIGIFRLNKWSNNHGESWLQALVFTVISTGILYLLFLCSIGRCFNSNGMDWSLIGYYFEFLTPTFKPDFISGERPSSCSIGLYYAGKAVFAYGLYQFIAAFRKHGRKK